MVMMVVVCSGLGEVWTKSAPPGTGASSANRNSRAGELALSGDGVSLAWPALGPGVDRSVGIPGLLLFRKESMFPGKVRSRLRLIPV